nr:unnamed protein product [Spirometra erinaceieuropaei]
MGERKGTNKYYPPDFDPKRHKSLNAYHGVHALRERGRKADQGVLIIRFEMPFNCWCLSCKKPIGMGVRYNAEKRKVGMYHSTPIYQFTMNCAMCAGAIVIQTDPQNFDYSCIEGVRRKCQTWDPEENEQIVIPDYKEKQKLAVDAMYQVEHGVKDKEKAAIVHPAIADLEASKSAFKDEFALNCLVRKQFREAKRAASKAASRDEVLVSRLSLAGSQVKLLPEVDDDASKAKLIRLMHRKYQGTISKDSKAGLENHVLFQSTSRASVPASISRQNTSSRSQSNSTDSEGTIKSDSLALQVTKETVRAHWMAQRAGAFSSSTKSEKEPLHHLDLSAAVKSGLIRRVSTSGDSGDPDCSSIKAQKVDEMLPPPSMPGAGLVGYDDSD